MPESPEVKIITEQLHRRLKESVIEEVNVIGGRFIQRPPTNLEWFRKELPTTITTIKCKGKFIWFTFANGWYLFNTLGMTGSWGASKEKHSAIQLKLNDGEIFFTDPRHFGTIAFEFGMALQQKLNTIGMDLLECGLSKNDISEEFRKKLQSNKNTIVEILMNQKVFSGIGNYIKAETLYRSKVSPWRTGKSLSNEECLALLKNATDILVESYTLGGATLATYKNFEGEVGHYSSKLMVYGKTTDPLGNPVKSEETLDKRTTWWVPKIQK